MRAPDGSAWTIFGELHHDNPRLRLEGWEMDMIQLWRLFQGGMGAGHLPEGGGSLDQAAIMLDAFGVMNAAEAALKREHGER